MAVAAGVRADSCTTPVPSLIRSVWAASRASGVKASEPHDSADHTASNPACSAATVSSTRLSGIARLQYPHVNPICIVSVSRAGGCVLDPVASTGT